jgi:hypothetical protein
MSLLKTFVANIHTGSIAEGVLNPNDKRPEPGFEFQAPKASDSRGPCPGLNLLAK